MSWFLAWGMLSITLNGKWTRHYHQIIQNSIDCQYTSSNKVLCINPDNILFNVSMDKNYTHERMQAFYISYSFSLWRLMLICQNRFRYFENELQAYKYTFIMVLPVQIVVLLEKHALRSVYLLFIYYFSHEIRLFHSNIFLWI